jgi:hypothetical protein
MHTIPPKQNRRREILAPRDPNHAHAVEANATASIHYAERLLSQIKSFRTANNFALREMALLLLGMLQRELATNRGEDPAAAFSNESVRALLAATTARMGLDVAPRTTPLELQHYQVEWRRPDQEPFLKLHSFPTGVPLEPYIAAWSNETRATAHAITPVSDEEARDLQQSRQPQSPAKSAAQDAFTDEERKILDRLIATGAMKAYSEARLRTCELQKGTPPPTNMARHFLAYLGCVVPYTKTPASVHEQLAKELGGKITYYQANSVVMVVTNGEIRRFIPLPVLVQTGNRPQSVQFSGVTVPQRTSLASWNRTKYGYVPDGAGLFLEALRHSMGNYREMKPVPLRPAPAQRPLQPQRSPAAQRAKKR